MMPKQTHNTNNKRAAGGATVSSSGTSAAAAKQRYSVRIRELHMIPVRFELIYVYACMLF